MSMGGLHAAHYIYPYILVHPNYTSDSIIINANFFQSIHSQNLKIKVVS